MTDVVTRQMQGVGRDTEQHGAEAAQRQLPRSIAQAESREQSPRSLQSSLQSSMSFGPIARFFGSLSALFALVAAVPACSSNGATSDGDAGTTVSMCDNAKCKPNNHCIATATDTMCRFPCASHLDCPFNYHCDANAGGAEPYCVADTTAYTPQSTGQWGYPCPANQGLDTNPACDTAQGFWCHGNSPTDGAAFCTVYGCSEDADCGHGFYCGKTNHAPNVKTTVRSKGTTDAVCLPRNYCAPCSTDIDCSPADGVPQHCVTGTDGVSFCANECATDTNCHNDAKCAAYGGNFKACTPRAGVCAGDGSFCSPCRSDADCPNGYCFDAEYSQEKFCTVTSAKTCTLDANQKLVSDCGADKPPIAGGAVSCTFPASANGNPLNQCTGLVTQGTGADQGYVLGCWSKH